MRLTHRWTAQWTCIDGPADWVVSSPDGRRALVASLAPWQTVPPGLEIEFVASRYSWTEREPSPSALMPLLVAAVDWIAASQLPLSERIVHWRNQVPDENHARLSRRCGVSREHLVRTLAK